MVQTRPCYSRRQLSGYLQGRGGDQDATELEVHLQSCAVREQTICELDSEAEFLAEAAGVERLPHAGRSNNADHDGSGPTADSAPPAQIELADVIESIK